ncbi:MAG: single-stranded-DNA-specific exonuclease RecJ [Planctomycetota bacterium]|jgi:single-stranded-DNA-specific exonuclease
MWPSAGMQKKQWIIQTPHDCSAQLAKSLKISTLLAQVLINRGITDTTTGSTFLRPKLTKLIPPEQMPGIQNAVKRIADAVKNKQKITLYGDYDVDGITGVATLWQILTMLNANVDYYIPHRIDEGYGLNEDAVRILAKKDCDLLITVDCGITAFHSAKLAAKLGLELIITDHHQPDKKLPEALAIVHPALDENYPNQDSSGAMVAYKLAWAIANHFSKGPKLQPELRQFMINATTLAAIGTIADIMDLRGENRVLTSYGLKSLPECKMPGIQALIDSAGLSAATGLDSYHIGFRIAPMINAAGRMGHARLAVELLTSSSTIRATQIAQYLKEQNNLRRQYERKIFKQACEIILQKNLNHPDQKTIVLASDDWHTGVIGIVASRIVDRFHRPTILINTAKEQNENQLAQGSARSIPGFCLLSAIKTCAKHLNSFGGHKMAAGITIHPENIENFAEDFEKYANKNLNHEDIIHKLQIDAPAKLAQLSTQAVEELQMLEPFGQGNPKPLFATKGVRLSAPPRKVGTKGEHLQLAVTDNTNSIRCIGFGMGKLEKKLLDNEFFNVAYQPNIDTYNGNRNVQLVLEDIQFE